MPLASPQPTQQILTKENLTLSFQKIMGELPTGKLSKEQLDLISHMLASGAKAYGYHNDTWTSNQVAQLIESTFGIKYHNASVRRIIRKLNIKPLLV